MENIKELEGKTIRSIENIRAEYGRTVDNYICIVCSDGEKLLIGGGTVWKPRPTVDDMKKAPNFFTAEEISDRVLWDEKARRTRDRESKESRKRQYEKMKKEFEIKGE